MKKRILTTLLSLCILCSMAVPVLAAVTETETSQTSPCLENTGSISSMESVGVEFFKNADICEEQKNDGTYVFRYAVTREVAPLAADSSTLEKESLAILAFDTETANEIREWNRSLEDSISHPTFPKYILDRTVEVRNDLRYSMKESNGVQYYRIEKIWLNVKVSNGTALVRRDLKYGATGVALGVGATTFDNSINIPSSAPNPYTTYVMSSLPYYSANVFGSGVLGETFVVTVKRAGVEHICELSNHIFNN